MWLLKRARLALVLMLLTFSNVSCTRTVDVPVAAPKVHCPLPPRPAAPELTPTASGKSVTFTMEEVTELAIYIAGLEERMDVADACLAEPALKKFASTGDKMPTEYQLDPNTVYAWLSGVDDIIAGMQPKGVKVTVYWKACGFLNAAYDGRDQTITMCYELFKLPPGVIRFVAAHEMTHAILQQLDLPFTGMEEMAADEYAAVWLLKHGHKDDVKEAIHWFDTYPSGIHGAEDPYDEHPSDARRSWQLEYMWAGYLGYFYQPQWKRIERAWERLIP